MRPHKEACYGRVKLHGEVGCAENGETVRDIPILSMQACHGGQPEAQHVVPVTS